jgi:hypothetical protein
MLDFLLSKLNLKSSKKKKLRQTISYLLAGLFPLVSAFFKYLGFGFGALNFVHFFYYGSVALTAASFASPVFPLICFFGLATFLITFVEDRVVYEAIQNKLETFLGIEKEKNLNQMVYDRQPISPWKRFSRRCLAFSIRAFGIILPIVASCFKGMAASAAFMVPVYCCYVISTGAAVGVIGIGSLLALGPIGWVILGIGIAAGLSAAGISLYKDGRVCYALASKLADYVSYTPPPAPPHWTFTRENLFRKSLNLGLNKSYENETDNFLRWQAEKWSTKRVSIASSNSAKEDIPKTTTLDQPNETHFHLAGRFVA